jgi:hypothetical protein
MLALRLNWGPPWWDGSLAGEFSLRVFLRDAVLRSDQASEMLANTDKTLIQKANRSPRRLFQLVSILFEQRAQKWAYSGKRFDELHIQADDLRYLLERLHLGAGTGKNE